MYTHTKEEGASVEARPNEILPKPVAFGKSFSLPKASFINEDMELL